MMYVEAVLRFGLPARFRASLIETNNKGEKKLRKALNDMYNHLLGSELGDISEVDQNTFGLADEDFYPYVFLELFVEHETK